MTTVNMVKRAIPTTRVRSGVAWNVRMRYSRGVVRRCMDNSSARTPVVSDAVPSVGIDKTYTFGCGT